MNKTKKLKLSMMSDGELRKSLTDFRDSIRSLRFKAQGSKSKNVKETLYLRRQIARVLTEISKRKIGKTGKGTGTALKK